VTPPMLRIYQQLHALNAVHSGGHSSAPNHRRRLKRGCDGGIPAFDEVILARAKVGCCLRLRRELGSNSVELTLRLLCKYWCAVGKLLAHLIKSLAGGTQLVSYGAGASGGCLRPVRRGTRERAIAGAAGRLGGFVAPHFVCCRVGRLIGCRACLLRGSFEVLHILLGGSHLSLAGERIENCPLQRLLLFGKGVELRLTSFGRFIRLGNLPVDALFDRRHERRIRDTDVSET
jgi:hypothetical protein